MSKSTVKRLVEQTFLDMYQHRNSEFNKSGLNRMESNEENKQAAASGGNDGQ